VDEVRPRDEGCTGPETSTNPDSRYFMVRLTDARWFYFILESLERNEILYELVFQNFYFQFIVLLQIRR
jgi:hypothetical protein